MMKSVQVSAPEPPAVRSESATVLAMLDRMSADPAQPVERLEQMFALYQKVQADAARKAFMAAFVVAQAEMGHVVKNAHNPQTKSKYATHAAIDALIKPVYSKHGFAMSYDTADSPLADCVRVLCYLIHTGGHEREYRIDMPADGKGAKGGDVMTKTHATGAAASYGKRYLEINIWNLALVDKDTDGNMPAGPMRPITGEQAEKLAKLITESKTNIDAFLRRGGVESLSDIPAAEFGNAEKILLTKIRDMKQNDR